MSLYFFLSTYYYLSVSSINCGRVPSIVDAFCAQPKNYLLINAALFLPNGQSSGTQNKVTDTHGFFLLNICNITHDDVDQSVFHQRKKDENLKLEIANYSFLRMILCGNFIPKISKKPWIFIYYVTRTLC